jgi:hypothetical protein
MSFISGMKKKAGEMVSQMMDEDGGPDGERLRQDVERVEASLQAQIKELKGFVTGMNSMLGSALGAAQLYRDEGGDAKLAAGVRATPPSPPDLPPSELAATHSSTRDRANPANKSGLA